MNLYRIKEVTITFSHGDEAFYYPQQKSVKITTTGKLWWKKDIRNDIWLSLYKDKNTGTMYVSKFDNTELIGCSKLEDAEAVIKTLLDERKEYARKHYKEYGAELSDDNEKVKIHPVL